MKPTLTHWAPVKAKSEQHQAYLFMIRVYKALFSALKDAFQNKKVEQVVCIILNIKEVSLLCFIYIIYLYCNVVYLKYQISFGSSTLLFYYFVTVFIFTLIYWPLNVFIL